MAGCSRDAILAALHLQEADLSANGFRPRRKIHRASISTIDLAINKQIDWKELFNHGVTDGYKYHGQEVVRIVYKTRDGEEHPKIRVRKGTSGHDSEWVKESPGKIIPYGAWRIDEAELAGYLVICEGESDCWTGWHYDLPFLGIPGATNDSCLITIAKDLASIPAIYILQEPDQVEKARSLSEAGKGFYARVFKRLRDNGYTGKIYCIDFKKLTGAKDPNELHKAIRKKQESAQFREIFEEAMHNADPADDSVEETATGLSAIEKAIGSQDIDALYEAIPVLASLPETDLATLEKYMRRIKETFGSAVNLNQIRSTLAAIRKQQKAEAAAHDIQKIYEKTNSGMVYYTQGGNDVSISNFTAEILADVEIDDGTESTRSFTLRTELFGHNKDFEVSTKEFVACDWVERYVGARAIVTTGQSMRSHLVNAIKYCSTPKKESHYAHTGWKKLNGQMVYLHAGGAVSQVRHVEEKEKLNLTHKTFFVNSASGAWLEPLKNGVSQVSQVSQENIQAIVKLTGSLAKYELPAVYVDLKKAVRASLRFLTLGPDPITFPLYAALWRSVLGHIDFGVHLAGQTGLGKTELVALLQQHFGVQMDPRHLPGSWEGTDNSLEMLMSQARDTLLVIDDFKPRGGKMDQDRLHAKADRIFRDVGNGTFKSRLNNELKQRVERRPGCMLLSTGEDVPRGQSLKARGLVLLLEESVTVGEAGRHLFEAQQNARSGLYSEAMLGYLAWLASRIERIQEQMPTSIAAEREALCVAGHARAGSNTANLILGMKYFLQFAYEIDVLTAQEAQTYLTRCIAALLHVAKESARENHHDKPSEQWKRLLVAALTNKTAHLVSSNKDKEFPGIEYGWVKTIRNAGNPLEEEETVRGGGIQIGWIDDEDIYLNPSAAYKAVRAMGEAIGDPVITLETTLRKFLVQDKVLASTDIDKVRNTITVRRRLAGVQRDVLHIAKVVLYPEDPPTDSPDLPDFPDSEASKGASEEALGVSQVDDSNASESSQVVDTDAVGAEISAEEEQEAQRLLQELEAVGGHVHIGKNDAWAIGVPEEWSDERYREWEARILALDKPLRQMIGGTTA